MDETAADIDFDEAGNCNYCNELIQTLKQSSKKINNTNELDSLIDKVRRDGHNSDYDCIVGLSGGADSSYALHLVKKLGLRPLAVHMDNGWNSELAVNNIKNMVEKLDVHLYTHVIDWEEYKSLMQAFFDADVIDVELLYDNAMLAVNYNLAKKYNIKYILSGSNTATEGMRMPSNWNWYKYDKKNIFNIAKRGNVKIKTFPTISTLKYQYHKRVNNIAWIPFLDYFEYNKSEAMQYMVDEYEYKVYPYKHYESIFTRFYQAYILPEKFQVDKRKSHLSTLICTGQTTREDALKLLSELPYNSQKDLDEDKQYFLKKMNWTPEMLDAYIKRPEISHLVYGSEYPMFNRLRKLYKKLKSNTKK